MLSIVSNKAYGSRPIPCKHVPIMQTFCFDDICPGDDGLLMTEKTADDVVMFVDRVYRMGFVNLIVHCDEGISRSTAVAKAIVKAYKLPEETVEYRQIPDPNPHVYKLMTEAFKRGE